MNKQLLPTLRVFYNGSSAQLSHGLELTVYLEQTGEFIWHTELTLVQCEPILSTPGSLDPTLNSYYTAPILDSLESV